MKKIEKHRRKIDNLDKKILKLLEKRFKIIRKISIDKHKNKLKVFDKDRERKVLKKLEEGASDKKRYKQYIQDIFEHIIKNSKKMQNQS